MSWKEKEVASSHMLEWAMRTLYNWSQVLIYGTKLSFSDFGDKILFETGKV